MTSRPSRPPDPAVRAAAKAARADEIVKALNPEQARAVTTTDGPLLILAGAGSGKTRVLAHRIAYLVGVKGVAPWRILAVTFTNRAAAELRERIISLVGEAGRDVQAGTFHSLCARVLRRDGEAIGIDRRFVIYDTDDQQALMKQILARGGPAADRRVPPERGPGRDQPGEERDARRRRSCVEHAANHRERTIARLATRYQERLRKANALDFDDLLLEAVRLFDEAPAVLAQVPGALALPPRRRVPGHEPGAVPVGPGARGEAPQPRASSATTTSRSTRGAARTCATSSTSSATGPTRPSSSSSRTTARRS